MYFVKYGDEYLHDPRINELTLLDLSLEVKMKKEIDVNRLWINEEITQKSGAKYIKQLCEFINEGKPIIIYLNSVGGDVDEGLAIVDLIEHAKSKGIDVTTVGISTSSSPSSHFCVSS